MTAELLKTILGAGGIATVLLGIIGGIIKLVQNRIQANREDDLDDRSWVELYRSYVEEHLIWDNEMRSDVLQLRRAVDELRAAADIKREPWPPIKPAPKLFPKKGSDGTNSQADSTHPQ